MDKIIKQKAHLYDMLKKEIGGGIMQVQNNVLEQLLAAHHPNKSFLEKNSNHYYYERFSLAEIRADQGHVSEPFQHSHDAYKFLIPYGPIPMLMLKKLRISYAKLLLEFSEETIAQIAEQCGFQKANTFSTTFKKATGMSPMEYKKNQSGS